MGLNTAEAVDNVILVDVDVLAPHDPSQYRRSSRQCNPNQL